MTIEYIPDIGFKLGSNNFNWGESREEVRQKLKNRHEEDDRVIENTGSDKEDTNQNIQQRRDIYEDIENGTNYFFLSFDNDNCLNELEVHWGVNVKINDVEMEFEKDITIYLKQIKSSGYEFEVLEEGNYLCKKLKMTIADSQAMGGKGNDLSYFYSSNNIEHLIEN
ncbi:MAG: hypothetical protein ACPGD5_09810 [Salibacteraceae bacterium]